MPRSCSHKSFAPAIQQKGPNAHVRSTQPIRGSELGNSIHAQIKLHDLEIYLQETLGSSVQLKEVSEIGLLKEQGMKDFGYGKSLEVTYEKDGQEQHAVLSVMRGDRYGHQFYWDRAAVLMFEHDAGVRMEKHVKPLGLGYIDAEGRLVPLNKPREFFILNEKVEGCHYFEDLERIRKTGLEEADIEQARGFARWLARIHERKLNDPDLYLRHVRRLIGDSECIWGLVDAYPLPYKHFPPEKFKQLEKRLIDWRWKLRKYTHRLAAVHGDFHPWNVMIRSDGDFNVLDRSRGEWGDPADDIATMTCNYFLYGLYTNLCLSGDFEKLYMAFWKEYLKETEDYEILEIIAPFYVFRGLVLANPEWYPSHPVEVREALLRFVENVLTEPCFDYSNINTYIY
ncbi:aminoglycoside phosphotransferase family protein [Chloroflexota bacterium]